MNLLYYNLKLIYRYYYKTTHQPNYYMTVYIYILELVGGKYYVGRTQNLSQRIQAHKSGIDSSMWVKKYPMVRIVNSFEGDNYDEDKVTKQLMAKHGIDNVRGGAYVTETLSSAVQNHLQNEIAMANDLCIRCRKPGHFIKDCPEPKYKRISKQIPEQTPNPINTPTSNTTDIFTNLINKCIRCGHFGHVISGCFASTSVNGKELIPLNMETTCIKCRKTIYIVGELCYCKDNVDSKIDSKVKGKDTDTINIKSKKSSVRTVKCRIIESSDDTESSAGSGGSHASDSDFVVVSEHDGDTFDESYDDTPTGSTESTLESEDEGKVKGKSKGKVNGKYNRRKARSKGRKKDNDDLSEAVKIIGGAISFIGKLLSKK